jgi:hypothetical protein
VNTWAWRRKPAVTFGREYALAGVELPKLDSSK